MIKRFLSRKDGKIWKNSYHCDCGFQKDPKNKHKYIIDVKFLWNMEHIKVDNKIILIAEMLNINF
ncbi:hypothetical protein LT336_00156 [Spiroplasma sp. JKS002671]|nr:hypothetical protein [Spiroplasma sp. JKS002671]